MDVLAEQQEWLRHLVQPQELRFEAPYPHSHFLRFLPFPDVTAHILAHKGPHHSSLLLHKRAMGGGGKLCKAVNSHWFFLTIKRIHFCFGTKPLGGILGWSFGDFKNQMEPLSFPWEYPTLGQEELFSPCFFPPFDISKSFEYHKIDLAVNGEKIAVAWSLSHV